MKHSIVSSNCANYIFSQDIIYFDYKLYHIVFICVLVEAGGMTYLQLQCYGFNILIGITSHDQTENEINKVNIDVLKNRSNK